MDVCGRLVTRTVRGRGRGLWWRRWRTATRQDTLSPAISYFISPMFCHFSPTFPPSLNLSPGRDLERARTTCTKSCFLLERKSLIIRVSHKTQLCAALCWLIGTARPRVCGPLVTRTVRGRGRGSWWRRRRRTATRQGALSPASSAVLSHMFILLFLQCMPLFSNPTPLLSSSLQTP